MLALLLETPQTPEEWQRWSFHHRDSHNRIREAVQAKHGVKLADYPIDPITEDDIAGFLQRNSQMHIDFDGVLNLQSNDLLDVDFTDPEQRSAWVFAHYQEHYDAELKLGI